jgi:aspartokinase-like uncharacterized kinase
MRKNFILLSIFSLSIIIGPFLSFVFFNKLIPYIKEKRLFNAINKRNLNDRKYIASIYDKLDFFLPKFISHLENNVKKVSGEFPEKFLQAGKSPDMTRLIQLEAMWREVEEREEN